MVYPILVDLVKIYALNTGTGTINLGAAVPAFRGLEALIDGASYNYSIQQGASYEIGTGVYSSVGDTLTRGVLFSSNGNAAIGLGPNAVVTFTALASDFPQSPTASAAAAAAAESAAEALVSANAALAAAAAAETLLGSNIELVADTARTIIDADKGKTLAFTAATSVTVTVPLGIDPTFLCSLLQWGLGQVTVAFDVGVQKFNQDSQFKTQGQGARLILYAVEADSYNLEGRTAA